MECHLCFVCENYKSVGGLKGMKITVFPQWNVTIKHGSLVAQFKHSLQNVTARLNRCLLAQGEQLGTGVLQSGPATLHSRYIHKHSLDTQKWGNQHLRGCIYCICQNIRKDNISRIDSKNQKNKFLRGLNFANRLIISHTIWHSIVNWQLAHA